MWFKLAGATFSINLGPMSKLSSSISIKYNANGFNYITGSVSKDDASASLVLTLNSNYTYEHSDSNVTVTGATKGSVSYSSGTLTIPITPSSGSTFGASEVSSINVTVTGAVSSGGEPDAPVNPTNYTFTLNPDPTSATVTLSATGYSTVSGTGSKSITVANGTTVNWSVSADGYTTRTGNWTISGGNKTENITLSQAVAAGSTIFDFDFTTKTLNDYVNEGVITIPSTSKTDELVYDAKGLTTNKPGTGAQLLNGAKLTNTFDIASDWTFEITMTIDPWQEDFGMTEALYNNFMFVTAAEHEMPLEDGKNHGSNCFTPAIYDNGGTFTGRFPKNGGVGISGASKTITADGVEHTYKWIHTESDQNNAFYKDGTKEKDTKWTNTSYTFGGQFGYVLGAHNGYSSATNFCLKKGFHIKSMKLYTN